MRLLSREFRDRLAELPRGERRSLTRSAWREPAVQSRLYVACGTGFAATMGVVLLTAAGVVPRLPEWLMRAAWVSIAPVSTVFAGREAARQLSAALVRDRPAICSVCGYLAGPANPCPECGSPHPS